MGTLKALNCSNCGANLKYNLGDPIAYCQYCDSVNIFDFTQSIGVQDDVNAEALTPRIMVPKEKFAANYFESAGNSQGGHLWIADTEIFFKPHAINFGDLSKKYMKIEDIVSMVKTNEMFGISRVLTITDKNGNSMKLVSWNRDQIISTIEKKKQDDLSMPKAGEETGNWICEYCGKQIEKNSNNCKYCGANLTQTVSSQVVQPTQTSNTPPPPPTNRNNENIGATKAPAQSSGKKSKKGCLKWVGIFVAVIIAIIIIANLFSTEKTFSTFSEQEQETLMTNLYERLDQYFVSDLKLNEKLAQLLVYEDETMSYFYPDVDKKALEKEGKEIGFKVGNEMMPIAEKWASDNNIDFEDWTNSIGGEQLVVDYLSHLSLLASEEAEAMMQEMKTTLREGLAQGSSENDNADFAWIVGDWINSDTNHEFTFEADGSFSSGDDCITTGTFTIQGNMVHLNGKTVCPDCEDCEESEYNETMTITGETLEGYQKFQ
ncbi:MAG: hypothetical protein LBE91_00505 [Tannerella sp.]|jgi:hypothetical protein|nr:hypothetical protein [Tannerella sp.]